MQMWPQSIGLANLQEWREAKLWPHSMMLSSVLGVSEETHGMYSELCFVSLSAYATTPSLCDTIKKLGVWGGV